MLRDSGMLSVAGSAEERLCFAACPRHWHCEVLEDPTDIPGESPVHRLGCPDWGGVVFVFFF